MINRIKIENIINTKEKIHTLKDDILKVALYLYENGRPDWYILQ